MKRRRSLGDALRAVANRHIANYDKMLIAIRAIRAASDWAAQLPSDRRQDAKTLIDIRALCDLALGIPADTLDAGETGTENSREEVTGRGTKSSKHATDQTGFTGGRPQPLGAALWA